MVCNMKYIYLIFAFLIATATYAQDSIVVKRYWEGVPYTVSGSGGDFFKDGSASMTGALNMGTFNITNVGLVDGIDIATDVVANTAKTSNETHTGEVTGATSLTITADAITQAKIADDAIQEEHLKAVNAKVDEYGLTHEATTGDFEWEPIINGDITDEVRTSTTPITQMAIQTQADFDTDGGAPAAGRIVFISDAKNYKYIQVALSDLTTSLTTGDVKGFWIAPADGEIEVSANDGASVYLLTPGTATGITVEIDKNGSDITTTGIRTDATENDSDDYSSTKFVLTTYTFVRGDKFAFNFDAVPTAGAGALVTLKVWYD